MEENLKSPGRWASWEASGDVYRIINAYAVERKDVKVREKVLYAEDIYLSKDVEDERTHFLTQR